MPQPATHTLLGQPKNRDRKTVGPQMSSFFRFQVHFFLSRKSSKFRFPPPQKTHQNLKKLSRNMFSSDFARLGDPFVGISFLHISRIPGNSCLATRMRRDAWFYFPYRFILLSKNQVYQILTFFRVSWEFQHDATTHDFGTPLGSNWAKRILKDGATFSQPVSKTSAKRPQEHF